MLPIFLVIIVLVLIVEYIGSRYKVAGANEALIVSGQRDRARTAPRTSKVVRGGGVIVLPLIHKVGKLKLTARQINVNLADAVTRQGIKVAVQGVATFKIGADDESIRNAAERFLEAQEEEVDSIVKNVLEGSLRSIVGTLTVEELNLDRQKFQQAVRTRPRATSRRPASQIDSFTIQAIRDESGLHGAHRPAGDGSPRARRAHGQGRRRPGGRRPEAEAEPGQDQRRAGRRPAPRRDRDPDRRGGGARRSGRAAGPGRGAPRRSPASRPSWRSSRPRRKQELVAPLSARRSRGRGADPSGRGRKGARSRKAQAEAERSSCRRLRPGGTREVEVGATRRRQADDPRGQRRGRHRPHQGRGGAKALAPGRGLPPVQRGGHHPDRPVDAAGDRPRRRGADGQHRHLTVLSSDGASEVVKNATRTVTEAADGEGPDRHRHPRAASQRSAPPLAGRRPATAGPTPPGGGRERRPAARVVAARPAATAPPAADPRRPASASDRLARVAQAGPQPRPAAATAPVVPPRPPVIPRHRDARPGGHGHVEASATDARPDADRPPPAPTRSRRPGQRRHQPGDHPDEAAEVGQGPASDPGIEQPGPSGWPTSSGAARVRCDDVADRARAARRALRADDDRRGARSLRRPEARTGPDPSCGHR